MSLVAGAAVRDISPTKPMFLMGYTHTPRTSTGVHDPLLSSALYLSDGATPFIIIANDVLFVTKDLTARARKRIAAETDVPEGQILISASHTHSGPVTVDCLCSADDAVVPKVDPAYFHHLKEGIVAAGIEAWRQAQPAQLGLAVAGVTGIGTNRRNPAGPSDLQAPLLIVKTADGAWYIACMLVVSMHPTVLHEDSFLVSADFPGMARRHLQESLLGASCPVLYHTGPAGNQSPRYVTRGNTFAEAERLGEILGRAVVQAIPGIACTDSLQLQARQAVLDLPRKDFPSIAEAKENLEMAIRKLADMRQSGAPPQQIRTAEVDWFGAEETVTLAEAARDGRIEEVYRTCLPAEVQVLQIGRWNFAAWPGEIFIEHALALKQRCPGTFIISLANGELQGYIVTEEAALEGGYEASNSLFSHRSGDLLIETTARLLGCQEGKAH